MSAFTKLRKELRNYLSSTEIKKIYEAYLVAKQAHAKQTRTSGEPYITHPVAVALILAQMRMDAQSIMAAILHDVIEDTYIDKKTILERFGEQVAELVDGVSKLTQIQFETHAEAQAANFRKMILAMARDIRVILVKLADRLHNMRTLQHLAPAKRKRIAKETLEIYAPIANRLGMHNFRVEFEELGFAMLHPLRYRILKESVRKARGNRKEIIGVIEKSLHKALKNFNLFDFWLRGREKHLYSIYRKMHNKHLHFSEIMDVYAFRIVVKNIDTCYRALGAVHNLYKPVQERFKDYIAIPKANGYQSLHTTLFGPYGVPIEIQIRTEEMEKMAENGIAAHWLYKSEEGVSSKAQLRAHEWIKGLLEIQQSTGNSLEFIENVKIDLFPDEVYVFTPKGNIMELPAGATPVDFAYMIHSDIGNSCIAAKINRRLVPLSTTLHSGQTVEVITAPGARPNPAWLNFVVTGKARSNIRHYLKSQQQAESISLGRRMVEKALAKLSLRISDIPAAIINNVVASSHVANFDELLENVGLGNQMAAIIARRLAQLDEFKIVGNKVSENSLEPLSIRGTEGVVVNYAKCCYPIPGDPIEGVLTTGRGIVIHVENCKNLLEFRNYPDKCIPVRWEESVEGDFEVKLRAELINQRGVLATLALTVAKAEANINDINIYERDERCAVVNLTITVHNRVHLAQVIRYVRQLNSIIRIARQR